MHCLALVWEGPETAIVSRASSPKFGEDFEKETELTSQH